MSGTATAPATTPATSNGTGTPSTPATRKKVRNDYPIVKTVNLLATNGYIDWAKGGLIEVHGTKVTVTEVDGKPVSTSEKVAMGVPIDQLIGMFTPANLITLQNKFNGAPPEIRKKQALVRQLREVGMVEAADELEAKVTAELAALSAPVTA